MLFSTTALNCKSRKWSFAACARRAGHSAFSDAPRHRESGIAGIRDVSAPADVVGMENVKPTTPRRRHGVALGRKESTPASLIKKLFLRERDALFHDLVRRYHGAGTSLGYISDLPTCVCRRHNCARIVSQTRGNYNLSCRKKDAVTKPFKRDCARQEKVAHVGALQFQQLFLFMDSARISGQTAVCADHPVAGDDDGDFVMSDGTAHRLRDNRKAFPAWQAVG